MIVAFIIVCVLLLFVSAGFFLLFQAMKTFMREIDEIEQLNEEMAFYFGEGDFAEEDIVMKYENAIIFYNLQRMPKDKKWTTDKIVDTSLYLKYHIIGLTYFVQEQLANDINSDLTAELRERIMRKLAEKYEIEEDSEVLDDIVNNAMAQELKPRGDCLMHTFIPHCTVYYLRDGRWMWRQEEELEYAG